MWTVRTISGHQADIFEPAQPPRFAVLFLHPRGGESPAEHEATTRALDAAGLACCAPKAPLTWWSNRLAEWYDSARTARQYLLDDVQPWMRQRWSLGERAIAVAGISMGGQAALSLGFQRPDLFPVVAGIASALEYQIAFDEFPELPRLYRSREQCRQDTAILQVKQTTFPRHIWFACDPHDTAWFPGNDRLREKLRAVGIPHTADLESSHGGHDWNYFDAMTPPMFEFIQNALLKESRRLL